MCDLKYLFQLSRNFTPMATRSRRNQSWFSGRNVRGAAGIVLVAVLLGWCLLLLPDAIDQAFSRSAPQSYKMGLSGEHQYHPTTHAWTFIGSGK